MRPVEKMSAVVLGYRILMTTALKRDGLYSALRQAIAILRRSSLQFKSAVATKFCNVGGFSFARYSSVEVEGGFKTSRVSFSASSIYFAVSWGVD